MIIVFPDENAFGLALTSAAVAADVSGALARGAIVDGRVFIEPGVALTKEMQTALAELGAKCIADESAPPLQPLLCWHQLLPLTPTAESDVLGETAEVLFEVDDAEELVELCQEMLRLGNDRIALARLVAAAPTSGPPPAGELHLVRVINPPYYTLLRATSLGGGRRPRAYVQRRPRVWVELGYSHASAEQMKPPRHRMLLLRAPHDWRLIEEPTFRDVYSQLEVSLPLDSAVAPWRPAPLETPLRVSLRLAPGGSDEPATLWVLHDDALQQVESLVEHADSAMLERLSFAVGTREEQTIVVLRARPSQQSPPVLVLRGVALRSYLQLPNLFVPCGQHIDPPLRRDVLAAALASDAESVTWLNPSEETPSAFTPETLPDHAFRPLTDWVEYVLDSERTSLDAWVQATHFDFASFVSVEDAPQLGANTIRQVEETAFDEHAADGTAPTAGDGETRDTTATPTILQNDVLSANEQLAFPYTNSESNNAEQRPLGSLELKRFTLEQQFLQLDAPLDAAERLTLWRDLARLNTALDNAHDATVGWTHVLWRRPRAAQKVSAAWLAAESGKRIPEPISQQQFEQLASGEASSRDVAHLAASLVHAAHTNQSAQWSAQLKAAAEALHRHEALLPIRAAWLAWQALAALSGGDVLSLTRARDRLLTQLLESGLRLDVDAPTFVRSHLSGGERLSVVRGAVVELRRRVHRWINGNTNCTAQYVDLVFAYALARLGEPADAERLLQKVSREFHGQKKRQYDQVHRWLFDAFELRIHAALAGESTSVPLPAEHFARLDGMDRVTRYKIDRMRSSSHILEPHERIDPYRRQDGRYEDRSRRELAQLFDLRDCDEIERRLRVRLNHVRAVQHPGADESWMLATALELAPRLSEVFTAELLQQSLTSLSAMNDLEQQARVLEKGLLAAAHYALEDDGRALAARLEATFRAHVEETDGVIDTLLGPALRGLRKLGLRKELSAIMEHIAQRVRTDSRAILADADQREKNDLSWQSRYLGRLRILLHLASAWLYFGEHEQARRALDESRDALFALDWERARAAQLSSAYLAALADAETAEALTRMQELLRRLPAPSDVYTTSSHYSRLQLEVVEAAVLTLIGDDSGLDPTVRRWLDEDELLVRDRIHHDTRAALAAVGLS